MQTISRETFFRLQWKEYHASIIYQANADNVDVEEINVEEIQVSECISRIAFFRVPSPSDSGNEYNVTQYAFISSP